MEGIFISHSTKNRELVEHVVEFLQTGMGISRENIFCTSLNGALPTGEDFIAEIKENMKHCKMVMALITPEYLQSPFCMMELGAAWIQSTYLCPLLAGNTDFKDLERTPLRSVQMRKLGSEEDLFAIYDELLKQNMIAVLSTQQFSKKLPDFLKKIRKYIDEEEPWIYPDTNGYYEITIEKERRVPKSFRCYKIKGRLDLKEWSQEQMKDETHWIFFQAGVYDELKRGDRVLVKVGKTERKYFADIGYARNIYPDELYIRQ